MKRGGLVITIIVAVLALGCGFGSAAAFIGITQPSVTGSTATVQFTVQPGDSTASVAQRLQDQGLIRNAQLFRLWARYKHLDTGIEPGVYQLKATMSMDAIIKRLQQATPDFLLAGVNEGLRVTQYADGFANLPNFNADEFLKIAKTGILTDGTKAWVKYWYVSPPQPHVFYVLEGYLYPDHYAFDKTATAQDVVETMLKAFGEHLCPNSNGPPDAYITDAAQCKAHAATVDTKGTTVFQSLEQYYDKDDVKAIYKALTVASITMREIPSINDTADIAGIASVYYNRWQHALNPAKYPSDTGTRIQADPTVQYAHTTDTPPKQGESWWPNLNDQDLSTIDKGNPYNTYVVPNLPPGPIAAPLWVVLKAAANPVAPDGKQYYYFINAKCKPHKTYFGITSQDQDANIARYLDPNIKCS